MTKEIIICDRCGREINYPTIYKYNLSEKGENVRYYDFCFECYKSLTMWAKEKKIKFCNYCKNKDQCEKCSRNYNDMFKEGDFNVV